MSKPPPDHLCSWYCNATKNIHAFPFLVEGEWSSLEVIRTVQALNPDARVLSVKPCMEADTDAWKSQLTAAFVDGISIPIEIGLVRCNTPWLVILQLL